MSRRRRAGDDERSTAGPWWAKAGGRDGHRGPRRACSKADAEAHGRTTGGLSKVRGRTRRLGRRPAGRFLARGQRRGRRKGGARAREAAGYAVCKFDGRRPTGDWRTTGGRSPTTGRRLGGRWEARSAWERLGGRSSWAPSGGRSGGSPGERPEVRMEVARPEI